MSLSEEVAAFEREHTALKMKLSEEQETVSNLVSEVCKLEEERDGLNRRVGELEDKLCAKHIVEDQGRDRAIAAERAEVAAWREVGRQWAANNLNDCGVERGECDPDDSLDCRLCRLFLEEVDRDSTSGAASDE